jgi:hypothetical protein
MRTTATLTAALATLAVAAATASAQKSEAYQVTFESVANSCEDTGINLTRARVQLDRRGKQLSVTIPMIPIMKGSAGRRGNFKAKAKRGKTGIAGLDGKFSIAGSTKERSIEFVLIAEYYKGKSPLCTQSWRGTGTRTTARGPEKNTSLSWLATVSMQRMVAYLR